MGAITPPPARRLKNIKIFFDIHIIPLFCLFVFLVLSLFIYETEAGMHGPFLDRLFEEWDFRTPADLITEVTTTLKAQLKSP